MRTSEPDRPPLELDDYSDPFRPDLHLSDFSKGQCAVPEMGERDREPRGGEVLPEGSRLVAPVALLTLEVEEGQAPCGSS